MASPFSFTDTAVSGAPTFDEFRRLRFTADFRQSNFKRFSQGFLVIFMRGWIAMGQKHPCLCLVETELPMAALNFSKISANS